MLGKNVLVHTHFLHVRIIGCKTAILEKIDFLKKCVLDKHVCIKLFWLEKRV